MFDFFDEDVTVPSQKRRRLVSKESEASVNVPASEEYEKVCGLFFINLVTILLRGNGHNRAWNSPFNLREMAAAQMEQGQEEFKGFEAGKETAEDGGGRSKD